MPTSRCYAGIGDPSVASRPGGNGLWRQPGAIGGVRDHAQAIGCDHDVKSKSVVKHSWPYPADFRDLRWGNTYKQIKLKLKPTHAAFVTATVTMVASSFLTSGTVTGSPRS